MNKRNVKLLSSTVIFTLLLAGFVLTTAFGKKTERDYYQIKIYTIEIIPPLGKEAKKRFEILGYKNVMVKVGDGYFGWDAHAPFDCIIVTAVSTHVPPPLIQQLKKGGKMVIPLGNPFQIQNLMLIEKSGEGEIKTKNILPVRFAPLVRKWR